MAAGPTRRAGGTVTIEPTTTDAVDLGATRARRAPPLATTTVGTAILVVYVVAVLASPDYPRDVWGLDIPTELAESYRWALVLGAGPPVLIGLLLVDRSPWPSGLARGIWIALGATVLLEAAVALSSTAPLHGLVVYVARDAALWWLFVALVRGRSTRPLRWAAAALVAAGLLQGVVALGQGLRALTEDPSWLAERWLSGADAPERAAGLTAHPNVLGALVVTTLPLGALVFASPRRWLPIGAVGVAALAAAGSRASAIGLAAGMLVAAVVARGAPQAVARRTLVAVLLLAAAVGAAVGVHPAVLLRLGGAGAERMQAQEIAVALWRAHPWVGVGSGNFAPAARQLSAYADQEWRIVPAHNWLLLRLAEGGAAGACLALIVWAGPVLWLLARGAGRRDAALACAFTALAVGQWFDYQLQYWLGGAVVQVLLLALWIRRVTDRA